MVSKLYYSLFFKKTSLVVVGVIVFVSNWTTTVEPLHFVPDQGGESGSGVTVTFSKRSEADRDLEALVGVCCKPLPTGLSLKHMNKRRWGNRLGSKRQRVDNEHGTKLQRRRQTRNPGPQLGSGKKLFTAETVRDELVKKANLKPGRLNAGGSRDAPVLALSNFTDVRSLHREQSR